MEKDPILEIERLIKNLHDEAGKYTKPVLNRYPLLFAFLLTFSLAAVLHGFDLVTDKIPLFEEKPWILMVIGVVSLLFTGTLYKLLENDKKD
jgi:drug/metabolite transporter (DMT)-like permease